MQSARHGPYKHCTEGNTLSSETSVWPQIPIRTPKPYLVSLLSVTEDYETGLPAAENADLSTWASSAAASPEHHGFRCLHEAPHVSLWAASKPRAGSSERPLAEAQARACPSSHLHALGHKGQEVGCSLENTGI